MPCRALNSFAGTRWVHHQHLRLIWIGWSQTSSRVGWWHCLRRSTEEPDNWSRMRGLFAGRSGQPPSDDGNQLWVSRQPAQMEVRSRMVWRQAVTIPFGAGQAVHGPWAPHVQRDQVEVCLPADALHRFDEEGPLPGARRPALTAIPEVGQAVDTTREERLPVHPTNPPCSCAPNMMPPRPSSACRR
jgi:hypothetical protein